MSVTIAAIMVALVVLFIVAALLIESSPKWRELHQYDPEPLCDLWGFLKGGRDYGAKLNYGDDLKGSGIG